MTGLLAISELTYLLDLVGRLGSGAVNVVLAALVVSVLEAGMRDSMPAALHLKKARDSSWHRVCSHSFAD